MQSSKPDGHLQLDVSPVWCWRFCCCSYRCSRRGVGCRPQHARRTHVHPWLKTIAPRAGMWPARANTSIGALRQEIEWCATFVRGKTSRCTQIEWGNIIVLLKRNSTALRTWTHPFSRAASSKWCIGKSAKGPVDERADFGGKSLYVHSSPSWWAIDTFVVNCITSCIGDLYVEYSMLGFRRHQQSVLLVISPFRSPWQFIYIRNDDLMESTPMLSCRCVRTAPTRAFPGCINALAFSTDKYLLDQRDGVIQKDRSFMSLSYSFKIRPDIVDTKLLTVSAKSIQIKRDIQWWFLCCDILSSLWVVWSWHIPKMGI